MSRVLLSVFIFYICSSRRGYAHSSYLRGAKPMRLQVTTACLCASVCCISKKAPSPRLDSEEGSSSVLPWPPLPVAACLPLMASTEGSYACPYTKREPCLRFREQLLPSVGASNPLHLQEVAIPTPPTQ